MYAQPWSEMCSVKSFKDYIHRLHPDCDDLKQRSHDSFNSTDDIWYCNCPLGKNTLGKMMATISSVAGISDRYTNHCIRATSISALDRAGFEARHIIRASGHKSEQSVKSYIADSQSLLRDRCLMPWITPWYARQRLLVQLLKLQVQPHTPSCQWKI